MADSLAVDRRFLAELATVPRDRLDADSRLTYDIFVRRRELDIEGVTYPAELFPVDPFDAMPLKFARAAAEAGQRPFPNARDYENWLRRIDGCVLWMRQAIVNMREGIRRGYTLPRAVTQRALPLIQALGEDSSANPLYAPLRALPDTLKETERSDLRLRLTGAVKDKLLPAYREMHDFLQNEYLPRARLTVGLSALPLGPAWYAYRLKRATGTKLSPNEIHAIGLAEVERIRARMQALPGRVPAAAPAAHASAPAATHASAPAATHATDGDPLGAIQELKNKVLAAVPALFSAVPQGDFEIHSLGPFHENAPLVYRPADPASGLPAVLYVDTAVLSTDAAPNAGGPPGTEIARFLEAAVPGRHFQSALQQERADLPKFRRFDSDAAFVEGWALYAASLGEELGLYPDDEAKHGALSGELKCAAALVVDTGLHAKGWTREQAVDYLRAQLGADDAAAQLDVDRYIALPADALACKMGELKFQALRSRAQQALGARFDIREFHAEILKDGAMPMDILDAKLKLWTESPR